MEKAVLKTLIYADIFNYPLKINEIQKWMIGKRVDLQKLDKILRKMDKEKKIKCKGEYYFLKEQRIVNIRKNNKKHSLRYLRKAKFLSQVLKIIPWIKLVGISGGLALDNASKADDIDLFIITAKNRLWISRLLILMMLSLFKQRRRRRENKKVAGKLCVNMLLEEDRLEQECKDIYTAHEVLQMKVLWQRDGIYRKYLEDNSWAMKFLPNWIGTLALGKAKQGINPVKNTKSRLLYSLWFFAMKRTENLAKLLQLKIMGEPIGMERIQDGALYFHPKDCRNQILFKYQQRIKALSSN